MAVTKNNWLLDSYVDATWTNLIAEEATVASLFICNVSSGDVVVEVRIDDGAGAKLATVLAPAVIAANESFSMEMRSLNVVAGQRLQVKADAAGAEFIASGVS